MENLMMMFIKAEKKEKQKNVGENPKRKEKLVEEDVENLVKEEEEKNLVKEERRDKVDSRINIGNI